MRGTAHKSFAYNGRPRSKAPTKLTPFALTTGLAADLWNIAKKPLNVQDESAGGTITRLIASIRDGLLTGVERPFERLCEHRSQ